MSAGAFNAAAYAGDTAVAAAIASASSRLVDIIGLGDSNQLLSGIGWDHGWQYALSRRYSMYATGLLSCRENGGSGSGTGYKFQRVSTAADGAASTGAPATLDDYLDKGAGDLTPHNYFYAASDFSGSTLSGMTIDDDCPVDVNANLRYEVDHGTFDTGSPTLNVAARRATSPYTAIADDGGISTNTGAIGIATATLAISAAARDYRIQGMWVKTGVTATAPVFALWQTFINTDRTAGFRYSTLNYRGGESLRTQAYDLQELSDTALDYYLERIRARQVELGQSPVVVVAFQSGLNDRNETLASVGPATEADGDSAEAFVDNADAVIARVRSAYTRQGWDQSGLYFLAQVSHPVSDPNDTELAAYENALKTWATDKPQVAAQLVSGVLAQSLYVSEGYYASGGADTAHLVTAGYEAVATAMVDNLSYRGATSQLDVARVGHFKLEEASGLVCRNQVRTLALSEDFDSVGSTDSYGYLPAGWSRWAVGVTAGANASVTKTDEGFRVYLNYDGAGGDFLGASVSAPVSGTRYVLNAQVKVNAIVGATSELRCAIASGVWVTVVDSSTATGDWIDVVVDLGEANLTVMYLSAYSASGGGSVDVEVRNVTLYAENAGTPSEDMSGLTAPGVSGRGVLMDGTQHILAPYAAGFGSYPFSMGCAFKHDGTAAFRYLMSIADADAGNVYWSLQLTNTGVMYVLRRNTTQIADTTGQSPDTNWHTALAVFPDATSAIVYLDGAEVRNSTSLTSVAATSAAVDMLIGDFRTTDVGSQMIGNLDEASFWTRALSAAEAAEWHQFTIFPLAARHSAEPLGLETSLSL